MKKFNVQQRYIQETEVSSNVVNKIYDIVIKDELLGGGQFINLNDSKFIGIIFTSPTYQEYIDKINSPSYFPLLEIHPSATYIKFQDPIVEQILLNSGIGDGIGITINDATSVTQLPVFTNNTNITSFNELKYFTKIKSISQEQFKNCTNLTSIDLSNITTLNNFAFYSCSNLSSLGNNFNFENINYFGQYIFANCQSLRGDIILRFNASTYYGGMFCNTGFDNIKIISSTITHLGHTPGNVEYSGSFENLNNCNIFDLTECSLIDEIIYNGSKNCGAEWLLLPPSAYKYSYFGSFTKANNIVVVSTIIPDELNNEATWYEWNDNPNTLIYVPNSVYNTWLNSTKFTSNYGKGDLHLRKTSQLPQNIKNIYNNINIDCDNL